MGEITRRGYRIEWFIGDYGPTHVHVYDAKERFLGRLDIQRMRGMEGWLPEQEACQSDRRTQNRRQIMKTVITAKKPFGTASYSPVKHARYLDWEDAFDVEFEDGLSFLEPHKTIKKANKISSDAVPSRVSVPRKFRTHFKIEYDNGEIAEVSWSFIRKCPPKARK